MPCHAVARFLRSAARTSQVEARTALRREYGHLMSSNSAGSMLEQQICTPQHLAGRHRDEHAALQCMHINVRNPLAGRRLDHT